MHGVRWDVALKSVLESHGLWYRFRDKGMIIRIAPRREIDAENESELERARHRAADPSE